MREGLHAVCVALTRAFYPPFKPSDLLIEPLTQVVVGECLYASTYRLLNNPSSWLREKKRCSIRKITLQLQAKPWMGAPLPVMTKGIVGTVQARGELESSLSIRSAGLIGRCVAFGWLRGFYHEGTKLRRFYDTNKNVEYDIYFFS